MGKRNSIYTPRADDLLNEKNQPPIKLVIVSGLGTAADGNLASATTSPVQLIHWYPTPCQICHWIASYRPPPQQCAQSRAKNDDNLD